MASEFVDDEFAGKEIDCQLLRLQRRKDALLEALGAALARRLPELEKRLPRLALRLESAQRENARLCRVLKAGAEARRQLALLSEAQARLLAALARKAEAALERRKAELAGLRKELASRRSLLRLKEAEYRLACAEAAELDGRTEDFVEYLLLKKKLEAA